jgi:SNF2 family DNA or RNA helicase
MNQKDQCLMFYDKFAGDHGYNNEITKAANFENLFKSKDYKHLIGKPASDFYNTTFASYKIPEIDSNVYEVHVFNKSEAGMQIIYTIIKINCALIKAHLLKKEEVPDSNFLKQLCRFDLAYKKASMDEKIINTEYSYTNSSMGNANIDKVIKAVMNVTSYNDVAIPDPEEIMTNLFEYQKKTISWMLQREKNLSTIQYSINEEVQIGDVYYDIVAHSLSTESNKKTLTFNGGALIDQMGLGKTLQMTTLSLLNPPKKTTYIVDNNLCSSATLVICPNQLCGQWKRELAKMINVKYEPVIIQILSKVHFEKYTYQDLLDADFVIISYTFLDNNCFLNEWMSEVSRSKSYHRGNVHAFEQALVKGVLEKQNKELIQNPTETMDKTCCSLLNIRWQRLVIDEFHEIYTVQKYSYMMNIVPLFKANYKWCMTGTPFEKNSNCLYHMVDFVTDYKNIIKEKIFSNQDMINFLSKDFFRRNTKQSIRNEYKLPPLEESIMWLKFTHTERMMYNAYLANPNNDKYSVFLRQLCCHPKLADEIKGALSNCKTLKDIEKMMVHYYESDMDSAYKIVKKIKKRIKFVTKKIKKIERKQLRKQMKKQGLVADSSSESESEDENEDDSDLSDIDADDLIDDQPNVLGKNNDVYNDIEDELDLVDEVIVKKDIVAKKEVIAQPKQKVVGKNIDDDAMLAEIIAQMGDNTGGLITLDNLKDSLTKLNVRLQAATKEYEGKKTTYNFYKTVVDRIKKTAHVDNDEKDEKNKAVDKNPDVKINDDSAVLDIMAKQLNDKAGSNSDADADADSESEQVETCGICLDEINEFDIGVTKCGHIFCYQCISLIVGQKHQCPYCRKHVADGDVFMISYEIKKKNVKTLENKNEEALINEIGTKLASLISFIKKNNAHSIIFSQWDDLLRKIGKILSDNGVKNVFCRGNVFQRDKAIREFNANDDIKVIMLSSESAASGTNLTKASQVILIDPVYGSYEFRKNTEGQAIGRAHRLGQKNNVKVIRFIIKDTIEEEIYKLNAAEDKKHASNSANLDEIILDADTPDITDLDDE